jgi:hypothetical protein
MRKMKILHTSDWHADWKTNGIDRFDDVQESVAQSVKKAREDKVDLYLFTGDLSDPEDGPRALRAASLALDVAMELAGAGIPSWWLMGNHDPIMDGSGRSTLSPLRSLRSWRVRVFEEPSVESLPGRVNGEKSAVGSAVLLPYPPATSPYDPSAFVRRISPDGNVVLVAGHLQVENATPGDETTEMARGRDVFFPFQECRPEWLLLNGHYHHGQTFERHGRKLHVPGSMVRLNHGEEDVRPRYVLWEI